MSTLFAAFPPPSVELLIAWFRSRDVFLDDRLELRETADSGWAVYAREAINVEETSQSGRAAIIAISMDLAEVTRQPLTRRSRRSLSLPDAQDCDVQSANLLTEWVTRPWVRTPPSDPYPRLAPPA